jgi:hemolysin activation/secretion protein
VVLSYPFVRTLSANLHGDLTFGVRDFHDETGATETRTDKRLKSRIELGVNGDWRYALSGLPVLTTLSVIYTRGKLELEDPDAQSADATTARSTGDYDKWMVNSSFQLGFGPSSLYLRASAQMTGDNLDSYEKFALGGPYSVRAYPSGETLADKAVLVSAEWRQALPAIWGRGLDGIVFYDRARGSLDAQPWTDGNNHVTLSGFGVGLNCRVTDRTQLSSTLAFRGGRKMTAAPDHPYQLNVALSTAF